MKTFAAVLSVLLLSGIHAVKPPAQLESENVVHEFRVLESRGRFILQTTVGRRLAQEAETGVCLDAVIGADLYIVEGRVLRTLNTSSIILCCEECQSMDACTTFRRNRSSDLCELISIGRAEYETNPGSDFDIGGFLQRRRHGRSTPAPSPSQIPDCRINQGITYPNGNVLVRGYSPTARHCCEVCRASRDCYSWYYNNRNNRCTLNRNIPTAVRADSSRFSGGTRLD